MAILIGTDEAGYGPNLGPLIVTATMWQVPDASIGADLYEMLHPVVCRSTSERAALEGHAADRLPIADSKQLYKPGGGLGSLETGVMAALAAAGIGASTWRCVWETLAPGSLSCLSDLPWYCEFDRDMPVDADLGDVRRMGRSLGNELERHQARLLAIRSVAIFPNHFNQLVSRLGSKGAALSHETLGLVELLLRERSDEKTLVECDKHGGRNRYGPVLQTLFPDFLVEIVSEGRQQSRYRWGRHDRRIEFRFTAKGESFLPAALASMVSKYLRELAMLAFNEFWIGHLPGLRPTAGYPVDARRFKSEIEKQQRKLGINDAILWRSR